VIASKQLVVKYLGKGLRGAFDSPMTKKALSLGIMFIFLLTLAGLTVLGGAGSQTLFAIVSSVGDFKELIGLGAESVMILFIFTIVYPYSVIHLHNHWNCSFFHGFKITPNILM
jgi:hypothetical protein